MAKKLPFSSISPKDRARVAQESLSRNIEGDRIAEPLLARQLAQLAEEEEQESQPQRLAAADDTAPETTRPTEDLPAFTRIGRSLA